MKAASLFEEGRVFDIALVDMTMPEMDGFELISQIRRTHAMDQLAIIGVSGSGGSVMSARFLKKGANDFIVKPFDPERLLKFFQRHGADDSGRGETE